jgi:hypothetical protein
MTFSEWWWHMVLWFGGGIGIFAGKLVLDGLCLAARHVISRGSA